MERDGDYRCSNLRRVCLRELGQIRTFQSWIFEADLRAAVNDAYAAIGKLKELALDLTKPIVSEMAVSGKMLESLRPPVAANPKRRGASLNTMQVLIVEDHEDSRDRLEQCLTRRDHNVAAAGDLQTALDFLKKQPFDAIVSDIALPDGTGYALINEVRLMGIRALKIAISGHPYPSGVEELGATGFHHYLSKPINCDLLCSLLERKPL